jgi:hypothetical protein
LSNIEVEGWMDPENEIPQLNAPNDEFDPPLMDQDNGLNYREAYALHNFSQI